MKIRQVKPYNTHFMLDFVPGGLKNKLAANEYEGNIVMKGPNTFGFPPFKKSGSILRSQVGSPCVSAAAVVVYIFCVFQAQGPMVHTFRHGVMLAAGTGSRYPFGVACHQYAAKHLLLHATT